MYLQLQHLHYASSVNVKVYPYSIYSMTIDVAVLLTAAFEPRQHLLLVLLQRVVSLRFININYLTVNHNSPQLQ